MYVKGTPGDIKTTSVPQRTETYDFKLVKYNKKEQNLSSIETTAKNFSKTNSGHLDILRYYLNVYNCKLEKQQNEFMVTVFFK